MEMVTFNLLLKPLYCPIEGIASYVYQHEDSSIITTLAGLPPVSVLIMFLSP